MCMTVEGTAWSFSLKRATCVRIVHACACISARAGVRSTPAHKHNEKSDDCSLVFLSWMANRRDVVCMRIVHVHASLPPHARASSAYRREATECADADFWDDEHRAAVSSADRPNVGERECAATQVRLPELALLFLRDREKEKGIARVRGVLERMHGYVHFCHA